MRKRYFFFDIDGTLAAGPIMGRYIPESTKRALEILESEGHFLAICTGRLHAMGEGFMHELGFQNMVADGGNSLTPMASFWESSRSIRKHASTLSRNASVSASCGQSLSTIPAAAGLAMPTTTRLCTIRIWKRLLTLSSIIVRSSAFTRSM